LNYITEINKFYDWLETNPVSDSSIVLWHALMHINNKCGWKKEFAVAISTLELKTGLSKSSILRSRNNLAQAGRIVFRSRNGQQSSVYSMISFHGGAQNETQSGTQTVTQSGAQSETQTVPITKLNEKKLNETTSAPAAPLPPEKKEKQVGKKSKAEETPEPYWEQLVEVWFSFGEKKFRERPSFDGQDPKIFKRIIHRLKKRAEIKQNEWNEATAPQKLQQFLDAAFTEEWLSKHFILPNLEKQFDIVIQNQKEKKVNGTAHQQTSNGKSQHAARLGNKSAGFGLLNELVTGQVE
jgi:hypothetical protein